MFKKAVFITVLLVALSFGTAFAIQIDSLASLQGPGPSPVNVFVNPGGLGDALIYGYYNVRDNYADFFTVTNTASYGVRARIRFREAATLFTKVGGPTVPGCDNGSQEVLDFDICLSKHDMWSGIIQTDANGAAILTSPDTDTFIQAVQATTTNPNPAVIFPTAFPSGVEFKFGSGNLGITADQTREGYFEVFAERVLSDQCGEESGKPPCTCGDLLDVNVDGAPIDTTVVPPVQTGSAPGNVLMGHNYIVSLSEATTFAYAATAIGDFAFSDITGSLTFNRPNFKDDNSDEPGNIGPVNYALTKSSLKSVYDLEASVAGNTQLIVNFPTKWLTHVDYFESESAECDPGPLGTSAEEVGDDIFDDPRVLITVFDDAEHSPTASCQFSPCPPGTDVKLPNEVNVISLNNSQIFTSDGPVLISTTFDFGWINIDLTTASTSSPVPAHLTACDTSEGVDCTTDGTDHDPNGGSSVTFGLPAIGYNVMKFAAGDISGLIPLQYDTIVSPEQF